MFDNRAIVNFAEFQSLLVVITEQNEINSNHVELVMLYSRIVRLALRALPNSTQRLLIAKHKAFLPQAFTQIFIRFLIEVMAQQVIHPMVKLQRNVQSLVDSQIIKPTDSIWKIALLYGDEWQHWKRELVDFGFTMQDPVKELLAVEGWDEE